jgi:hypothetical protein
MQFSRGHFLVLSYYGSFSMQIKRSGIPAGVERL